MSVHIWRTVNGGTAREYVMSLPGNTPATRPWLPRLQCACWWAVAVAIVIALCCEFGGGW